jgi:hypothetical protein
MLMSAFSVLRPNTLMIVGALILILALFSAAMDFARADVLPAMVFEVFIRSRRQNRQLMQNYAIQLTHREGKIPTVEDDNIIIIIIISDYDCARHARTSRSRGGGTPIPQEAPSGKWNYLVVILRWNNHVVV